MLQAAEQFNGNKELRMSPTDSSAAPVLMGGRSEWIWIATFLATGIAIVGPSAAIARAWLILELAVVLLFVLTAFRRPFNGNWTTLGLGCIGAVAAAFALRAMAG